MTTIKCNYCPTVIVNEDVLKAVAESDHHLASSHPDATEPSS